MKKLFLSLAAVALMMSACTQDVATPEGNIAIIGDNVAVTATFSPETRTAMAPNADGGLDITWVAGDAIGLFGEDANSTIGTNAEYTATTEGKVSGFAYAGDAESIKWGEGTHTFYAYYPYTETGSNYAAIPASIPAVQTQSAAGNLDHLQPYSFLYASCEASKYANGGNIELQFQNAFSVLEVKLCAAEGTIACDAVIFRTTDENEIVSASNILVNLTDGSLDFSNAEATNEIRINLAEAVELNTETPASIYAMITPGHAGKTFQAVAVVGGKEVVLGEMAVPESGIPAGVKAVLSLNVPAPAAEEAIDLSAAGTANCYIVNKANTAYKFNATVKGNGTTALSTDVAAIAPVKAYLLWAADQATSDLENPGGYPSYYGAANAGKMIDVTSVELKEDGYIYFKTGAEMPNGNAVICATDAEGNIVWSWHMWIVNGYDAAATDYYVTTKGVNTYMMDRNLGATGNPALVANPNLNDYIAARGLCYQWGRKDPFTSNHKYNGYAIQGLLFDAEGNSSTKYLTYGDDRLFQPIYCDDREGGAGIYNDIQKIVEWTASHPINYMRAGSTTSYKWIATNGATEEWGKLWGNQGWESSWDKGGVKTMYDPCPVGYRVPSTGHFIFMTSHNDQAGAYYNKLANWKYNCQEVIFDTEGNVPVEWGKVEPYGLHFYINGVKTKSEGAVDGVQDYGVTPEGLQTMYIPYQGLITYSGSPNDNNMYLQTNAPADGQTRWMKVESGEFFYNATSGGYDQQAKALPVRCIRDVATVTPEPEPEPEPEVPTGVDLSANGTANAYVANAAGTKFKFKATVKGNGYDPISGKAAEAIDLNGANAYIFWGYKKTTSDGADNTKLNASILRESVKIEGDYITFETPAEMLDGNVGIAVADASGNIMWSWHIWCVQGYDYQASAVDVAVHGMNFKIMDRNMGAFSNPAAIENPTEEDYAYALGLLYQWGRKDPFLCGGTQYSTNGGTWFDFIKNGTLVKSPTFSIKGDAAFNYNDFIAGHGLSDFAEILPHSIKNPLQFYLSDNHWVSASSNNDSNGQTTDWGKIWGNQKAEFGGTKTMYDPCPVGYTVASPDHMKFITSTAEDISSSWPTWQLNTTADLVTDSDTPIKNAPWGLYFYTKGVRTEDGAHPEDKTVVFLPKHRWVDNFGKMQDDHSICFYSNAPSPNATRGGKPYKTRVTYKGKVTFKTESWTSASQAASALAVRCVSEN